MIHIVEEMDHSNREKDKEEIIQQIVTLTVFYLDSSLEFKKHRNDSLPSSLESDLVERLCILLQSHKYCKLIHFAEKYQVYPYIVSECDGNMDSLGSYFLKEEIKEKLPDCFFEVFLNFIFIPE